MLFWQYVRHGKGAANVAESRKSNMEITLTPRQAQEHLLLHGRISHNAAGEMGLSWSYSGCSFHFTGEVLTVTCVPYAAESPVYLSVEIDGIQYKMEVDTAHFAETFTCGAGEHTVTLRRASAQNVSPLVWVHSFTLAGETVAFGARPAEKSLRLEFLGDSITCGYGILGAPGAPYRTREEDATVNYAALTAKALDAEARFLSISGQGIVHACSGAVGRPIPRFFHWLDRNANADNWQFDDGWQPDAVIINAGTNDVGGKVEPAEFGTAAAAFVRDVRAHYPKAKIVWLYGLMNDTFIPVLTDIVEKLRETDPDVWFLPSDRIYAHPGECGANGHPGIRGHRRAAAELTALLKKIL